MIRIELLGPPRTKKSHNQIFPITYFDKKTGQKRTMHKVMPSEAYREWFKEAMGSVHQIKSWARQNGVELPVKGQVWVKAIFYCDTAGVGDLVGYEQGLGDWLQEPKIDMKKNPPRMTRDGAGIITDDKNIASWDGSRVRIDRQNPRIEIEIRPYQEHLERVTGHEVYEVKET